MKCLFCTACGTYFRDPANQALVSALFGEHAGDGREVWDREPDLSKLHGAYHALKSEPARGLTELRELAELGSQMSMMYLGDAFAKGFGAEVDLAQAASWFSRAGEAGYVPAFTHLGRVLSKMGDYAGAQDAFTRGVAAGDRLSVYFLGSLYKDAPAPYRDFEEAYALLTRAAQWGNVYAKRELASLLMGGHFGTLNRLRGLRLLFASLWQAFALIWAADGQSLDRGAEANLHAPSSAPA